MQLSMTVLRCPDQVTPEARAVSGGEFHVGRGPDVDWVLPDPDRLLSKRHFAIAFRGGGWQIADTSTNGTFLNSELDPIGRGETRSLRDGDRLRLGAYEIEVRLVDQPAQGMGGGGFAQRPGATSPNPFGDPFADDPLAPGPAPRQPFNEPLWSEPAASSSDARLPHDFDPLAPNQDEPGFGGDFRGPPQQDHSSAMEDALIPPAVSGYAAQGTGGIIPGDDLLPNDWDQDLLEGIAPPANPVVATPEPFAPPPRVAPPVVRERTQPPNAPAANPAVPDPFPDIVPSAVPVPAAVAVSVAAEGAAPLAEPAQSQPRRPQPSIGDSDLVAEFLKGADISGTVSSGAVAMMRGLGEAFRAMAVGLRAVLIARATIKSEFRIDQTIIRSHGNNPLKFSANDDDALAALLGLGRRVDMTPAAAIEESLRDLRVHELATVAAMQAAVRGVLDELNPEKIRDQAEQAGVSVLPAQRKARAWDLYEAHHARVVRALIDEFDSIFGKSFARAYEKATNEILMKESQ